VSLKNETAPKIRTLRRAAAGTAGGLGNGIRVPTIRYLKMQIENRLKANNPAHAVRGYSVSCWDWLKARRPCTNHNFAQDLKTHALSLSHLT
jgi:hypothetical protein